MFNRIANSPDILQRFSIIWLYLIIPYIILYNSYTILITSSNNCNSGNTESLADISQIVLLAKPIVLTGPKYAY